MARTPLAPLTFGVVYFTKCNAPISVGTIEARDYWAACKIAWKEILKSRSRKQIADFQLIDDPSMIAESPQHIRAAAIAIMNRRNSERGHRWDGFRTVRPSSFFGTTDGKS